MSSDFDPTEFVSRVANRLVFEFADASQAGTPGLIGAAREHPARVQLKKMLPGFVNVGSGIVIDSYGEISKQQDVVIYERHYCPVFMVNDTPEATYFPVEGVISVGEIKSSLDKSKLKDAFSKIVSAKSLKRHKMPEQALGLEPTVPFRSYGDHGLTSGTKMEEFDQENKQDDQIFGFILCGNFSLKSETLFSHAVELWKNIPRSVAPNLVISLNDGFFQPFDKVQNALRRSPLKANAIMMCPEVAKGFPHLIRCLNYIARHGRTVSLSHFGRYLDRRSDEKESFQISMVDEL